MSECGIVVLIRLEEKHSSVKMERPKWFLFEISVHRLTSEGLIGFSPVDLIARSHQPGACTTSKTLRQLLLPLVWLAEINQYQVRVLTLHRIHTCVPVARRVLRVLPSSVVAFHMCLWEKVLNCVAQPTPTSLRLGNVGTLANYSVKVEKANLIINDGKQIDYVHKEYRMSAKNRFGKQNN